MSARELVLVVALLTSCGKAKPPAQASMSGDATGARGAAVQLPLMQQRLLEAADIALPPGVAAESLPEPDAPGAKVLGRYCTQCHALPSPSMHGLADWPAVARRMWVRIDMMAGGLGVRIPSTAERAQLLGYLQSHALPVAEKLPAGPGKELFETVCSRCHVLTDPRVHSPPDWPVVVMRMEVNMEKMRMRRVNNAEAAQILTYLQAASVRPRPR
jgi:cytochrome c5